MKKDLRLDAIMSPAPYVEPWGHAVFVKRFSYWKGTEKAVLRKMFKKEREHFDQGFFS